MKTKIAIASLATVAAFASIGSAVAGELSHGNDQTFSPSVMSAPVSVAGYLSGGELYPEIQRLANQPVAQTTTAQAVPAIYATGGELYAPAQSGNGFSTDNTNMAE